MAIGSYMLALLRYCLVSEYTINLKLENARIGIVKVLCNYLVAIRIAT